MTATAEHGRPRRHLDVDKEWPDGITLSQREYARIFRGGRAILMVSSVTRDACLCPDCLSPEQKHTMREWLESIPEPPGGLFLTGGKAE